MTPDDPFIILTSVDPRWPFHHIDFSLPQKNPIHYIFTCFRIVLTISSCSEILLNCNQQWKKSVFTPWQTMTDIFSFLIFQLWNSSNFSYFWIFRTLLLAGVAYKVFNRKSRGWRRIIAQYNGRKTNKSSVFKSHVTVRVGHALATCPSVEFFVNVIFENIFIRKPIHSLLLFRAAMKISIENTVLKSRYFSSFLGFFSWNSFKWVFILFTYYS